MTVRRNHLLEIQYTRAGKIYIERRMEQAGFSAQQIEAALRLWEIVHLSIHAPTSPWPGVLHRRIHGASGAEELEVVLDEGTGELAVRSRSSIQRPLRMRGQTPLSEKQHADELASMALQNIVMIPSSNDDEDSQPSYQVELETRHALQRSPELTLCRSAEEVPIVIALP